MKKSYLILLSCVVSFTSVLAADKYWVGPSGGNWNADVNWSLTSGGSGGAGFPTSSDAVIFSGSALVNLNISATIFSLRTSFGSNNVTLYTSGGSILTILSSLRVEPLSTLKDSTSANVAFNVLFNSASHATALIFGDWIFEGGVPLSGSNGARFTADDGSLVTVTTLPLFFPDYGGRIIFKKNTSKISSTAATLKFLYGSSYISDNNLTAVIPAATWAKDSVRGPATYSGFLGAPAATIKLTGNMEQVQYLGGVPDFGRLVIDLSTMTADASLALPDGSKIKGNLEILNTNNHTLTLLAGTSATSSVLVEVGTLEAGYLFGGYLNISGSNTKVALAKASASAPATAYKLLVTKSFTQSGGNFSLQDFDNATGPSTLVIKNDLIQTGGSFITNSTAVNSAAKFMVVMDDPEFITGPSGSFSSLRTISMSSGTIDNARHSVTLRIDHTAYNLTGYDFLPNGVILQSPLEVGRLELARSPLTTSTVNLLTVSNPSYDAITVGNTGKSYINGPLRRAANTTQSYSFPTGKGNSSRTSYIFDSCSIVPASVVPSIYQAEYFNIKYPDLNATAPLKGISATEYWDITKISGSDAQVKLTFNTAVGGAAAGDALVAAHYVNGHWIAENGSVLTPGNITGGSVVSKPLSSFSAFTFGYANPADVVAVSYGGLSYKFFQGNFNLLPDFNALTPVKTGTGTNVDISVRPTGVDDGYAFIWEGFVNIPIAGNYIFETVSDDGSKIYFNTPYSVNAAALVNNDGSHAARSATGTINITAAGTYPVTITYFENDGGESMQLYWSGPGISRQLIPDAAFNGNAQPVNGLAYKFYQGVFTALPDFNTITPVKTGSSSNIDLNVRPAGIDDSFAFVWEGYINIPAPGNYTFETNSDDGSKFYLNTGYAFGSAALVNNDGIHAMQSVTGTVNIPAAGIYPVTITFFQNDGAEGMKAYWSGPGFARQQIPDAAFTSAATMPLIGGLNYKYYEGDFNALPDFSALTPIKTGSTANADIGIRTPGVNDHFAFTWDGYITLPIAGDYTFETISDDGSKVYFNMPYAVNGNSTVNNDGVHAPMSATGSATVTAAGTYPVSITYFEKDGGEIMQLYWSGPGISRQVIPDAAFSSIYQANAAVVTPAQKLVNQTVNLTKESLGTAASINIYPNPFIESFTVDYFNEGSVNNKITVGIYDLNGKLLYTFQPANINAGYNRWLINMGSSMFSPGVYMARINVNGIPSRTVKLIKIKK